MGQLDSEKRSRDNPQMTGPKNPWARPNYIPRDPFYSRAQVLFVRRRLLRQGGLGNLAGNVVEVRWIWVVIWFFASKTPGV